jgi:hypothetical protein
MNDFFGIAISVLLVELAFLFYLFARWIADELAEKKNRARKTALFIAPLLWLLLPSIAFSEVQISSDCRVKNRPPGRCGWCALETLARHHRIKALYGVVANHACDSRPKDLQGVLEASGVKYRMQARGLRSTRILEKAIHENLGAAVGFRPLVSGGRGHIVTLVEFGAEEVRILDPNDKDGQVRSMHLDAFLERWDGFALVLEHP